MRDINIAQHHATYIDAAFEVEGVDLSISSQAEIAVNSSKSDRIILRHRKWRSSHKVPSQPLRISDDSDFLSGLCFS